MRDQPFSRDISMVEMLIQHGADVNVHYYGETPLQWARGHKELTRILKKKGAKE